MKTTKTSNRRNFLLAAGLGSAGVAAAIVARPGAEKKAEGPQPADQATGYHVTEHILKYYRTTEV